MVQVPQVYIAPPPHVMAAEPGESDALLSARIARERAREATQEAARAKLRSMQEAARSWTPGQIRALYAPTPEEAQQEEEERQRKQAREEERLRARAAAAPIEEVDGPMAAADYDRLADRVARDLAEYAALHGQEPVAHPAVLALLKGGRNQGLTTRAQWHHWYAWACAELARHSVAHEVAPSTRQVVSWLLTDQVQRYAAERERMIARTLAATGRPAQEVAR